MGSSFLSLRKRISLYKLDKKFNIKNKFNVRSKGFEAKWLYEMNSPRNSWNPEMVGLDTVK